MSSSDTRPPRAAARPPADPPRRRAGTWAAAFMAGAVTLAVLTLAACTAAPVSSFSVPASSGTVLAALPGPGHPAWVVSRFVLARFVADPAAVNQLRGKLVYEILQPGQPPLPGVVAEPVVTFASASALKNAIRARQLPAGIFGVLYDPEAWAFTPAAEQRDPLAAATAAAAVAHAHGLRFIVAPAIDLTNVLSPTSPTGPTGPTGPGPRWRQFLSLDLIGGLAKVADVVELQAQSLEQDTSVYKAFVRAAAAQASAGRPGVGLLAGLSTNPPGAPVDAQQLTAAIQATRALVGGYWLNVPAPGAQCPACRAPRLDIAVQALQSRP